MKITPLSITDGKRGEHDRMRTFLIFTALFYSDKHTREKCAAFDVFPLFLQFQIKIIRVNRAS